MLKMACNHIHIISCLLLLLLGYLSCLPNSMALIAIKKGEKEILLYNYDDN